MPGLDSLPRDVLQLVFRHLEAEPRRSEWEGHRVLPLVCQGWREAFYADHADLQPEEAVKVDREIQLGPRGLDTAWVQGWVAWLSRRAGPAVRLHLDVHCRSRQALDTGATGVLYQIAQRVLAGRLVELHLTLPQALSLNPAGVLAPSSSLQHLSLAFSPSGGNRDFDRAGLRQATPREALGRLPALLSLEIRGGCFAMPPCALVAALPTRGSLTRLKLSYGTWQGDTEDAVPQLSRLTALRELDLQCLSMGSWVGSGLHLRPHVEVGDFAAFPHLSGLRFHDKPIMLSGGGAPPPALRWLEAGGLRWGGDPAACTALSALTRLELHGAGEAENRGVPGAVLAHLTSLQHLVLSDCEVEGAAELGEGEPWPGFTPALTHLSISSFGADSMQLVLPSTLGALRHLSIESEVVRVRIPPLHTMPNLTHLEFSFFRVSRRRLAALGTHLPALEKLILCSVCLGAIPGQLEACTNLTFLNLSYNDELGGDGQAAAALPPLPRLLHLDLQECDLQRVPPALAAMTALTRLDLEGNYLSGPQELDALGACVAPLSRLQEVNLSSCRLDRPPPGLERLPALEFLNLGHNRLRWDSLVQLASMTQLEILCLQFCGLTELPQELAALPLLRVLHLEGNQFGDGGMVIPTGAWPKLQRLLLARSGLRALPPGLHTLSNLQLLDLRGNTQFLSSGTPKNEAWLRFRFGVGLEELQDSLARYVCEG